MERAGAARAIGGVVRIRWRPPRQHEGGGRTRSRVGRAWGGGAGAWRSLPGRPPRGAGAGPTPSENPGWRERNPPSQNFLVHLDFSKVHFVVAEVHHNHPHLPPTVPQHLFRVGVSPPRNFLQ